MIKCPLCRRTVYSLKNHFMYSCYTTCFNFKPRHPKIYHTDLRKVTFRNWPKRKRHVDRLVEHGFFFTGEKDIVSCFWCNIKLENCHSYDNLLERHLNINPGCLFTLQKCREIFTCWACNALIPDSFQKHYEFCPARLQTDVDHRAESGTFPRNPTMCKRARRLQTFFKLPLYEKDDVQQVADNGFYFTGSGKTIACFYCDGRVNEWYPEEDFTVRHLTLFPNCKFAVFQKNVHIKMKNIDYEAMKLERNRFYTFQSWSDGDPDQMAKVGLFNMQLDNIVQCAFCKVLIGPWKKEYNPLKFHFFKSPGCPFLLGESLGNVPVEEPKLLKPLNPDMMDHTKRLISFNDWWKNDNVVFEMAKNGFYYMDRNFIKCFWCNFRINVNSENFAEIHAKSCPECLFARSMYEEEKNDAITEDLTCKICMVNKIEILFTPCNHLASCMVCADKLKICGVCRDPIVEKTKVYIS